MEKYIEIENSYRDKFINVFLEAYPILKDISYVIQEKIDGTNIRISFKDGKMTLGSRNSELPEGQDHMGLLGALETVAPVLDYMKQFDITLFGELFGEGIQNRIKYGKKRILFFDVKKDGEFLSFNDFMDVFAGLSRFIVPIVGIADSLQEALNWNCEIKSEICDSQAEGIVIKPIQKNYVRNDELFYLKKKSDKFKETTPSDKPKKERKDSALLPYLTESRMYSVFSKEGKITSKTEVGRYIKLVTEDAVKDYKKDNPDTPLTEDDRRVGAVISKMLLKEI